MLLVDDGKEFRSEFKACFCEYDIQEAQSAEEALKILKKPIKIIKAEALLESTGFNINQAAGMRGYKNTEPFIRQLKKSC